MPHRPTTGPGSGPGPNASPSPSLIHVDSLDDPRVAIYAHQRDQWRRARHRAWLDGRPAPPDATATGLDPALDPAGDLFIAEGDKVCLQLFTSPHRTVSLLVSDHRLSSHAHALAHAPAGVPVYVVPRHRIDELAGFEIHRGLLALGRRVHPGPTGALLRDSACAVVLEDLANHDNVGGLFRAVRALAPPAPGFAHPACVLLSPRCCDPLYRKALRVSMGNALHVPFAALEPWPSALSALRDAGFNLLAMHPDPAARDILSVHAPRPALVLGTEGPGLSRAVLDEIAALGGQTVRIPINPEADSLNVAVAGALALHRLRSFDV